MMMMMIMIMIIIHFMKYFTDKLVVMSNLSFCGKSKGGNWGPVQIFVTGEFLELVKVLVDSWTRGLVWYGVKFILLSNSSIKQ